MGRRPKSAATASNSKPGRSRGSSAGSSSNQSTTAITNTTTTTTQTTASTLTRSQLQFLQEHDEESAHFTTYRRRFPRLGGAFQLKKIPPCLVSGEDEENDSDGNNKNVYTTDRPAPLLCSKTAPYRLQIELEQNEQQQQQQQKQEQQTGRSVTAAEGKSSAPATETAAAGVVKREVVRSNTTSGSRPCTTATGTSSTTPRPRRIGGILVHQRHGRRQQQQQQQQWRKEKNQSNSNNNTSGTSSSNANKSKVTQYSNNSTDEFIEDAMDLAWTLPLFMGRNHPSANVAAITEKTDAASASGTTTACTSPSSSSSALAATPSVATASAAAAAALTPTTTTVVIPALSTLFAEDLLFWQDQRSRLIALASSQQRRSKSRFKRQRSLTEVIPDPPLPKRVCSSATSTTPLGAVAASPGTPTTSSTNNTNNNSSSTCSLSFLHNHPHLNYSLLLQQQKQQRHNNNGSPSSFSSEWDETILAYKQQLREGCFHSHQQQLKLSSSSQQQQHYNCCVTEQFQLGLLLDLSGHRSQRAFKASMRKLRKMGIDLPEAVTTNTAILSTTTTTTLQKQKQQQKQKTTAATSAKTNKNNNNNDRASCVADAKTTKTKKHHHHHHNHIHSNNNKDNNSAPGTAGKVKRSAAALNTKPKVSWQEAYRYTIPQRNGDLRQPTYNLTYLQQQQQQSSKRTKVEGDITTQDAEDEGQNRNNSSNENNDNINNSRNAFVPSVTVDYDRHRRCLRRSEDIWKSLLESIRFLESSSKSTQSSSAAAASNTESKDTSKMSSTNSISDTTDTNTITTVIPVYLSQALRLLDYASDFYPPEQIFKKSKKSCNNDNSNNAATLALIDEINQLFWSLFRATLIARKNLAQLMDMWSEEGVDVDALTKHVDQLEKELHNHHFQHGNANNNGSSSKHNNSNNNKERFMLHLDCLPEMKRQLQAVAEWQVRLEAAWNVESYSSNNQSNNDDLSVLEDLYREGRFHGFRSKNLLLLESKLEKAYQLRDRINDWSEAAKRSASDPATANSSSSTSGKETIRFTAAIVRDIHRLKFSFPEATDIIAFQQNAESWVDRANIAIRSRISLEEIHALIRRGQEMPLDLSEFLEKLQARAKIAQDWLDRFHSHVPVTEEEKNNKLDWLRRIREELHENTEDGNCSFHVELQEMASEGIRIPVEMECVKLLQLELDARNWTCKARKWVPSLVPTTTTTTHGSSCNESVGGETEGSGANNSNNNETTRKKAKLEDLQEHIRKASVLRKRLELDEEEKKKWTLPGEDDLCAVVDNAIEWFDKHNYLLEGDARRSQNTRHRLSIKEIHRIVEEANDIPCNIGSAHTKMTKLLNQAEAWFESHALLLERCGIEGVPESGRAVKKGLESDDNSIITVKDIDSTIEEAVSSLPFDLEEVGHLEDYCKTIKEWFDKAAAAVTGNQLNQPAKRTRRGRKPKEVVPNPMSVAHLEELISEGSEYPVDTSEFMDILRNQLQTINAWQSGAVKAQENILESFLMLKEAITEAYGQPSNFVLDKSRVNNSSSKKGQMDTVVVATKQIEDAKNSIKDDESASETTSSFVVDETMSEKLSQYLASDKNLHMLIKNFAKDAGAAGVDTPEGELGAKLQAISKWFSNSMVYLENQRDVFDKRNHVTFDRFLNQGREFLKRDKTPTCMEENDLSVRLREAWSAVIKDQVVRLEKILVERDSFIAWCNTAKKVLSDDKKVPIEKLKSISKKSYDFPANSDLIKKIRELEEKANQWIASTSQSLTSSASGKLTMEQAKVVLEEGEKLGITSNELRTLRNVLKAARAWVNRFKKCNLDHGTSHLVEAKTLLAEHEKLCVVIPEEAGRLEQAVKNYCICRRPYEGFMIGCDTCDEWFHGPCIGVTETKAGKVDKYVCPRCSISRVFKASASNVIGVIRKWTSPKDLKKARQVDAQKHQRKVRKETKDIAAYEQQKALIAIKLSVGHSEDPNKSIDVAKSNLDITELTKDNLDCDGPCDVSNTDMLELLTEESAQEQILMIDKCIDACNQRLEALGQAGAARQNQLEIENLHSADLRSWCLRVRSLVLVPSSLEQANRSHPRPDGSMSSPMLSLIDEAGTAGLDRFQDVQDVVNGFKCLAWSMRAWSILSRQPALEEIESLVDRAAVIKLPDEKALRMFKTLLQRANSWSNKVSKAITPIPGEVKPFDMNALRELSEVGNAIPLIMPCETRLFTVIEDNGGRHCVCGGPSDGRFMLSCDKCDRWFHGHCVCVKRENISNDEWKCPECLGIPISNEALQLDNFHQQFDVHIERKIDEDFHWICGISSKMVVWPPYGLFGSPEAEEALGTFCSAIPDENPTVTSGSHVAPGPAHRLSPDLVNAISPQPVPTSSNVSVQIKAAPSVNGMSGLSSTVTRGSVPESLTFATSASTQSSTLKCGVPLPVQSGHVQPVKSIGTVGAQINPGDTGAKAPAAMINVSECAVAMSVPTSPAIQRSEVQSFSTNGTNGMIVDGRSAVRRENGSCHYETDFTHSGSLQPGQSDIHYQRDMVTTLPHDVLVAPLTKKAYD